MIISILENEIMNFDVSVGFTEHLTPTGIIRLYHVETMEMAARLGELLFDTSISYISVQPSSLRGVVYDVRRLDYDFATVSDIDAALDTPPYDLSTILDTIDDHTKMSHILGTFEPLNELTTSMKPILKPEPYVNNVIRVNFRKGDKHA